MRAKLEEATRRADAFRAALEVAQGESTTSQAKVLLLRQRVEEAEVVARQNADEIRQPRILEHEHGPMFATLREEPTQPWATSARRLLASRTQSTMLAIFSSSLTW